MDDASFFPKNGFEFIHLVHAHPCIVEGASNTTAGASLGLEFVCSPLKNGFHSLTDQTHQRTT